MAKNSIDDIINANFTELQDLSKEDSTVNEWLNSGNLALNYVCSRNLRHGYPCYSITALYGSSGTGKSMLPAIAAKDPKVNRVVVIDSEGNGSGSSLFSFV